MRKEKLLRIRLSTSLREAVQEFLVQAIIEDFRKALSRAEEVARTLDGISELEGGGMVAILILETRKNLDALRMSLGEMATTTHDYTDLIQQRWEIWVTELPCIEQIRQGKKIRYIVDEVLNQCLGQREILKLEGESLRDGFAPKFKANLTGSLMKELENPI